MFYLFNLLLIPIYYFLIQKSSSNRQKNNELFFKVVCIHAVLFRVLANPLNYTDTQGYALAFENISKMSFSECLTCFYVDWGIGYVVLNWLLSRISSDPLILFTFLSVATVGGVMLFYKKTSHAYLLTVMFYLMYPMLYYMSFGVVRQHFSIVFLLAALYNIRNYKISIPLAVLGALMHSSSFIFLPFFIWQKFRFDRKPVVFYLACAIVIVVVFRGAISAILAYFPHNENFADEGSNNIVPIVVFGVTAFLLYLSGASKRLQTATERNIYSFLLYGLVISLCAFGYAGGGRLPLVFMYIIPVVLTYLKKYTGQKGAWYYPWCFALFCLIILLLYIAYDPMKYDYKTIFESATYYML